MSTGRTWIDVAWRVAAISVVGALLGVGNYWARFGALFVRVDAPEICEAPELAGEPGVMTPSEASALCNASDVIVLDVRTAEHFAVGHIAEAEHLPCRRGALRWHLSERLHGASAVIVYGADTEEARPVATSLMQQNVSNVYLLAGGYPAWEAAGLACSSGPCPGCAPDHQDHL